MPITGSIDVTRIDKGKLFKGKKGTYLDLVLIETPDSEYGNDYLCKQSVKKESNEKMPILGNFKIRKGGKKNGQEQQSRVEGNDEIPF